MNGSGSGSMSLVQPIALRVYNDEENKSQMVYAEKAADTVINPRTVRSRLDSLYSKAKESVETNYRKPLLQVYQSDDVKGMIINEVDAGPAIWEIYSEAKNIASSIEANIEPLYDIVVQRHNNYQKNFNETAWHNARSLQAAWGEGTLIREFSGGTN